MDNNQIALLITKEYARNIFANCTDKDEYIKQSVEIKNLYNEISNQLNQATSTSNKTEAFDLWGQNK